MADGAESRGNTVKESISTNGIPAETHEYCTEATEMTSMFVQAEEIAILATQCPLIDDVVQ